MQNNCSELEHILAKRRQLRLNTAQELKRIQNRHRALYLSQNLRTPSAYRIEQWFRPRLRSLEAKACSRLISLLNWCSKRLIWFALPRLATGRLSKSRAQSLWRVIKKLNRMGAEILRWQLRRHG